ncbi:hypothetical protein NQZ68_027205 [Dissostichus eleginoides]|nr:hypothetical protein NQZ68_027205 [Dissostichus eleginoides]
MQRSACNTTGFFEVWVEVAAAAAECLTAASGSTRPHLPSLKFSPSRSVSEDEQFVEKIQDSCHFSAGHILFKHISPLVSVLHPCTIPSPSSPLCSPDGRHIRQQRHIPFIVTENIPPPLTTSP